MTKTNADLLSTLNAVPLEELTAALDEIYRLRRALAYEAMVRDADLFYKTFPKTRRGYAEDSIERMRQSACGHSQVAYAGTSHLSLRHALKDAGAEETLTRQQLLDETPSRHPAPETTPGGSIVRRRSTGELRQRIRELRARADFVRLPENDESLLDMEIRSIQFLLGETDG